MRINKNSDHIKVKGHVGTWYVIDSTTYIKGKVYLLEHEIYGDEAPGIIVNSKGEVIVEDVYNGFEDLYM